MVVSALGGRFESPERPPSPNRDGGTWIPKEGHKSPPKKLNPMALGRVLKEVEPFG